MSESVTSTQINKSLEEHTMRKQGILGRGTGMGYSLYSIDYDRLSAEARRTIELIISDGPFPYPGKDGSHFGNSCGDLPNGRYLEYTVPNPATQKTRCAANRSKTYYRTTILQRVPL